MWINGIYGSELDGACSDKSELIAYTLDQQNLNAKRTAMLGDRKYDMLGAKKQGIYALASWLGLWGFNGVICRRL